MTVLAHVINGVIVPDAPLELPEGAAVRLEVLPAAKPTGPDNGEKQSLSEKFLKYAGKATGLPSDFARNHDHYIHGTPKE